jgi:hypothetical protein
MRMPFGVHRLIGRCHGFHTAGGSPLAPTIREQVHALGAPAIIPEASFETCRSFVSPKPDAFVNRKQQGHLLTENKATLSILTEL